MPNNIDHNVSHLFENINNLSNQFDDNQKVQIDNSGNINTFNDTRHFFSKNKTLNLKAENTLNNLRNALIDTHGKVGQAAFDRYITNKKATGKQRITFGDLKNISSYIGLYGHRNQNNNVANNRGNNINININEDNINNHNGGDTQLFKSMVNFAIKEHKNIHRKLFNVDILNLGNGNQELLKQRIKSSINSEINKMFDSNYSDTNSLKKNLAIVNDKLEKYRALTTRNNENIQNLEQLATKSKATKTLINEFSEIYRKLELMKQQGISIINDDVDLPSSEKDQDLSKDLSDGKNVDLEAKKNTKDLDDLEISFIDNKVEKDDGDVAELKNIIDDFGIDDKEQNLTEEIKAKLKSFIDKAEKLLLDMNVPKESLPSANDYTYQQRANLLFRKLMLNDESTNIETTIAESKQDKELFLDHVTSTLQSYQKIFTNLLNKKSDTYQNFSDAYTMKLDSCITVLNRKEEQVKQHFLDANENMPINKRDQKILDFDRKLAAIRQYIIEKKNDFENNVARGNSAVPKKYFKEFKKIHESVVEDINKAINDSFGKTFKLKGNPIMQEYNNSLSHQDWNTISSNITMKVYNNGSTQNVQVTSNIIPVSQMNNDIVHESYGDGVKGIPSGDRTTKHLPNLAKSNLIGKNNKVLFTGYRHAVIDSFGEKNNEIRKENNKNRAKELVTSIVQDRFSTDIKNGAGSSMDNPIVFDMASVSLLSPVSDEGKYTVKQNEALTNNNQPFVISIKTDDGQTRTVFVKPKMHKFVFAVNAFNSYVGSYTFSKGYDLNNKDAFASFFAKDGRIEAFMNNPNVSNADKAKVCILRKEIENILMYSKYKDSNDDVYALPARLALMNDLMGGATCYNCKSGKDRTGQLDVAIKALAVKLTEIDEQQINSVNDINTVVTSFLNNRSSVINKSNMTYADKLNLTTIAIKGGNMEMQKYNTGVAGSKIYTVSGVENQFTNPEMYKYYQGSSKYTKS